MSMQKVYRAIGLMSGTSLDGVIDVALIETDGGDYVRPIRYYAHPYDMSVRDKVRACFGKIERDSQADEAEKLVTDLHIEAVKAFGEDADVIGFHGQTITHDPANKFTWQIGEAQRLATETGIDVVADLRQADVKAGGQGAPLLPVYHAALLSQVEKPVAVLNLGGVANVTYVGAGGELIAFDCGVANALMDDFMRLRLGREYDEGGAVASSGQVQENIIAQFQRDAYFAQKPPKSLDRNHWTLDCVRYATDEDGMATLMEMTMIGIEHAIGLMPEEPLAFYVAGGGRKNAYLMDVLRQRFTFGVYPAEKIGWDGDATEAEGFAYLAVRSILGADMSFPMTTGAPKAMSGGQCYRAI